MDQPRVPEGYVTPTKPYTMVHNEEDIRKYRMSKGMQNTSEDILDDEEKLIEGDMMMRKEERVQDMEVFLHRHNMLINHKMYRCARRCYDTETADRLSVKECRDKCGRAEARFNNFVQKILGSME